MMCWHVSAFFVYGICSQGFEIIKLNCDLLMNCRACFDNVKFFYSISNAWSFKLTYTDSGKYPNEAMKTMGKYLLLGNRSVFSPARSAFM